MFRFIDFSFRNFLVNNINIPQGKHLTGYPRGVPNIGVTHVVTLRFGFDQGHHVFISTQLQSQKEEMTTSAKMTSSRRVAAVKIKVSKRLLKLIEEHHTNSLRTMYLRHYQPLSDENHDLFWVTRLPPPAKKQLRVHLCVVRGGDVLDWTDQEIGTKIIHMYKNK